MLRESCAILAGSACLVLVTAAAPSADAGGKMRILVDKVMQPAADWHTEEWMVKATADAGFTVYSPRHGYDLPDEVRQVAGWCAKYGLGYLPWMRGSLKVGLDDPAAVGQRMVWEDGRELPLWSPNADAFWTWTTQHIVSYARLAAEQPSVLGVFLDYENYSKVGRGNLYPLSYDEPILRAFADSEGLQIPELAPAERKPWLEKLGLQERFAAFQTQHWRERCRRLRAAVDRYSPGFRFCVYPAPGTRFITEAVYREWATERAPLILADACTYGRSGGRMIPQADALHRNRERLLAGQRTAAAAGMPFTYLGGIDPVVKGADPEFCGKNAVSISELTDGYWVFYEGPTYKGRHPEYWKWFTWANRAIAETRLAAWQEPREEPEGWLDTALRGAVLPNLKCRAPAGPERRYPPVKLRQDNILLLAATAGQTAEVELQHYPLANYEAALIWDLRDPGGVRVAHGQIPQGEVGTVRFTPTSSGVYLLGVAAGSCAYTVTRSNVGVGVAAVERVGVFKGPYRFYFSGPPAGEGGRVVLRSRQSEYVAATVTDAAGVVLAKAQTSPDHRLVTLDLPLGKGKAGAWQLATARADAGAFEDHEISVGGGLVPVLALLPGDVFCREGAQ